MRKHLLSSRLFALSLSFLVAGAFCTYQAHAQPSSHANAAAGGLTYLTPGMPPVMIHPTVEASEVARGAAKGSHGGGGGGGGKGKHNASVNLFYNGGTGGVGVETSPRIYLVLWGSQWSSDPSKEEQLLVSFFQSVGGSSWSNDNTQYCQGVASGTYFCNGAGQAAGNNIVFGGAWYDNTAAAPTHPTQSQIAAEAVRAEAKFVSLGDSFNPSTDQVVVATATGNNSTGFGTQYCAYHSYTSSSAGNIAYTNLPYITDAGASCGANFNGLGADAGITIVEGHEMSETITDQFPSTGWLDSSGYETGDKCAWISSGQGAAADVTFPNGKVFPVQSLWSNAFNNDAGGCVLSY